MTSSFPASQASCELVFPLVVLTPKSLEFSLRLIPRFVAGRAKTYRHTFQSPLQVGSELEEFVRLLHYSYGVRFVCVCQTILRRSATAFDKNVALLTRYLRVVLEPIPYAIYWGHRGFCKARHNFYAADGVHLNSNIRSNISSITE